MSVNRVIYDTQNVYIEGERLRGVQSCTASWSSPEAYVNAIGYEGGFVGTAVSDSLSAEIEIERIIVSSYDPIVDILSSIQISGEIGSNVNSFAFNDAFVNSYSCSCSIGELPSLSCSMTAYGDSGGGAYKKKQTKEKDDSILIATPGSLSVDVLGHNSNAIQSFELSVAINREPFNIIGQNKPAHYITSFPIEVDCQFVLLVQDYSSSKLSDFICNPRRQDLNLIFNDCVSGDEVRRFFIPQARLIDFSQTATIGGAMETTFVYKSLINSVDKVSKILKGEAFT